jgi:hypothetical protein
MRSRKTTSAPVFSRRLTWIGILILGSALASHSLPSAVASSLGVTTSSVSFSSLDAPNGIFSGGLKLDSSTGIAGFGSDAFIALGRIGMERTLGVDENRREEYVGELSSSSVNPGGVSSWVSSGMYFPRQDQTLLITNSTRAEGDTVSWKTRVQSLFTGSMTNNRIVWDATLADTYTAVYQSGGPGVLVAVDSSGRHPALVLKATSTAGEVLWGGPGGFETPLVDGMSQPTAYVHQTVAADFTVSVVTTILDHDPCSQELALVVAATIAGAVGTVTPTFTSCLGDAVWSGVAGEVTSFSIALDPRARPLAENQNRKITIGGLPDGALVEGFTPTVSGFSFTLALDEETEPGSFDLTVGILTATEIGGVSSFLEPFRSTAHLTVLPLVVPDQAEEPSAVEEPELVRTTAEATPKKRAQRSVAPTGVGEMAPDVAPRPRFVFVEPRVLDTTLQPVPKTQTEENNSSPLVVSRPFEPAVSLVPRPLDAGALLGASMFAVLLTAGLLALVRRRRSSEDNETGEWR